jgi:hypothetical protein
MEDFIKRETDVVEKCAHRLYTIPTFVNCMFLEHPLKGNRTYKGFIEDISLNELSLELRDDYFRIQESLLIYSTLEMTVIFHSSDGLHEVNLTGIITWCKRFRKKDKSYLHFGIRLYELSKKNRELLKGYLHLGIGDKNLIWNLWDNLAVRG